jgi:hypothetical protein
VLHAACGQPVGDVAPVRTQRAGQRLDDADRRDAPTRPRARSPDSEDSGSTGPDPSSNECTKYPRLTIRQQQSGPYGRLGTLNTTSYHDLPWLTLSNVRTMPSESKQLRSG